MQPPKFPLSSCCQNTEILFLFFQPHSRPSYYSSLLTSNVLILSWHFKPHGHLKLINPKFHSLLLFLSFSLYQPLHSKPHNSYNFKKIPPQSWWQNQQSLALTLSNSLVLCSFRKPLSILEISLSVYLLILKYIFIVISWFFTWIIMYWIPTTNNGNLVLIPPSLILPPTTIIMKSIKTFLISVQNIMLCEKDTLKHCKANQLLLSLL